jgi:hypothetical protein
MFLFFADARFFKRDKNAKEARQRKIHAFWKKKAKEAQASGPESNVDQPILAPEQAPEQAPAQGLVEKALTPVPAEASPTEEDPADDSQTPTEELSPHNSTDEDEEDDDAGSAPSRRAPEKVMSEDSKPVSVIQPPRKLQRDSESETEQQQTGLLCGCI